MKVFCLLHGTYLSSCVHVSVCIYGCITREESFMDSRIGSESSCWGAWLLSGRWEDAISPGKISSITGKAISTWGSITRISARTFFLAPHWSTWSPVETSKITSLVSLLMRRGAPLWWEAICLPPGSMCPGLLSATHRQCWEPAASSTTVQVGEFNFRLQCHWLALLTVSQAIFFNQAFISIKAHFFSMFAWLPMLVGSEVWEKRCIICWSPEVLMH